MEARATPIKVAEMAHEVRKMRLTLVLSGLAAAVSLGTLLLEAWFTLGPLAALKTESAAIVARTATIQAELRLAESTIASAITESATIETNATAANVAAATLTLDAQAVLDTLSSDVSADVAAINSNDAAIDATLSSIALAESAWPMTLHGESLIYASSGSSFPVFNFVWVIYKVGKFAILSVQQSLSNTPFPIVNAMNPLVSQDPHGAPTGIGGAGLGNAPADQDPSGPSLAWAPTSATACIVCRYTLSWFGERFTVTISTTGEITLTPLPLTFGHTNPGDALDAFILSWSTS